MYLVLYTGSSVRVLGVPSYWLHSSMYSNLGRTSSWTGGGVGLVPGMGTYSHSRSSPSVPDSCQIYSSCSPAILANVELVTRWGPFSSSSSLIQFYVYYYMDTSYLVREGRWAYPQRVDVVPLRSQNYLTSCPWGRDVIPPDNLIADTSRPSVCPSHINCVLRQ